MYILNSVQKFPFYFISILVLIIFSAKELRKTKGVWKRNRYASMMEEERKENYNRHKMKKDAEKPSGPLLGLIVMSH
jgi:hypothetical protein